jgi:hypothetical protein
LSAVKIVRIIGEVSSRSVKHQIKRWRLLPEATRHRAEKVFTDVAGALAGAELPTSAEFLKTNFEDQGLNDKNESGRRMNPPPSHLL